MAVAAVHGALETVSVNVTDVFSSPAPGVYVGAIVVALVKEPCPLCVHKMVPFDEVAPLTVAVPVKHIVSLPPAVAVGCGVTVTVGVLVNCLVQPVGV